MAAPLIIAAGAMAVGGLVQLYNAEKARGASEKRLKEIEALFNSIKPPDYDLTIVDPPQAHAQMLEMPEFSSPQAAPKFNLDKLEPKQLEQVGKFIPNIAPLIFEENPRLIEKSEQMQRGQEAQRTALERFMQIGEDGFDPRFQQRVEDARQRAQSEAQSRGESIMQDFARRGMGGSGMELAAKIAGSAEAMDRNAMMGLQAESDAYANQLNALAQGAQLGGQMFSQDMGMQARNADVINAFNQRMSKRHQDWENMRADMLNQADLRNLQEAQRILDYNIMAGNEADRYNQRRLDDLTKYTADFDTRERNRQDELAKWRYGAQGQERAYQDQRDLLNRQWRQGNIDRRNELKDRRFRNQYDIASGKSGMAQSRSALENRAAQDRNAAIQGLANLGMTYGMQKDNQQFQRELADRYRTPRRDAYAYNYREGDIFGA